MILLPGKRIFDLVFFNLLNGSYDHVLNFASRIFNSADDVDRNGAASKYEHI